jgi:Family of unknown function (DUF6093)
MSASTALARARQLAEKLMMDTCQITRKTGESIGAGGVITPIVAAVYSGKCRVQAKAGSAGSWSDIGEASRVVSRLELQLPISAAETREGDKVTITASTFDPQLPGKVFVVRDVMHKSYLTSRRITITETTS